MHDAYTNPEPVHEERELTALNPHDNGYDLVPGSDVTNARVGSVYYEDAGLSSGLVVRLDEADEEAVDDAEQVREWLAERGYALSNVEVIAALSPEGERR